MVLHHFQAALTMITDGYVAAKAIEAKPSDKEGGIPLARC
ncbi:hypothetical protein B4168_0045 [Anoxybacillus flavithermus]|nr:hypothetical protein B4168_0045 [Anoxybacillus flavithermus]OAO83914.1 hypothetical protein GT23_3940 [Parageobacillus thermoglucosidasius]